MNELLARDSHFDFGRNWRSFSRLLNDERIADSDRGVARLFRPEELKGKAVLDIGCGSGLPALSMLRAGAAHVHCVDLDPDSVDTTRQVLTSRASAWSVELRSAFDLSGRYDVVHSWGVLHHTGAMWDAVAKAASLVKPGGLFAFALYRKTPLCRAWRLEKRLYAHGPAWLRALLRRAYKAAYLPSRALAGKAEYGGRGMELEHDIRDWLGGYPYESASPEEVRQFMGEHGFRPVREILKPVRLGGLFGSGCDEYVFQKAGPAPASPGDAEI